MASGQTLILASGRQRMLAHQLIDKAPAGAVLNIAEAKRTTDQNSKFWAMLSDISRAKPMGRRHTPDDWKAVFMNACGWECQFIEGLDGRPFPQGFRSSQLTKHQMMVLIDYMLAFGAEHGVVWSEPQEQPAL